MLAVLGWAGVWAVVATQQQAMVRAVARVANAERQKKGSLIGGLSVGTEMVRRIAANSLSPACEFPKEGVLSNGAGEKR
jgi:hypothetical protein